MEERSEEGVGDGSFGRRDRLNERTGLVRCCNVAHASRWLLASLSCIIHLLVTLMPHGSAVYVNGVSR